MSRILQAALLIAVTVLAGVCLHQNVTITRQRTELRNLLADYVVLVNECAGKPDTNLARNNP